MYLKELFKKSIANKTLDKNAFIKMCNNLNIPINKKQKGWFKRAFYELVEVLKEIEQIDDTIYTVLASGMITEYDREKYENLGFDEIIKKPYRMEDLNTLYEKC